MKFYKTGIIFSIFCLLCSTLNAQWKVGDRVDVYYSDGSAYCRGSILKDEGNGKFIVRYDGCRSSWDQEVTPGQVKPQATVSAGNSDITELFGKWAMFTYSYPTTVTEGNNIYREYNTGAKSPPL